ncbi:MAG: hypothetical protein K5849_00660 [Bacteroidales bacterium]|nr:hypothetical protein [Bacteroidales bacterium]
MKKFILSALVVILTFPAFAQPSRNNEIAVTYGLNAMDAIAFSVNSLGNMVLSEDVLERQSTGNIGIEYFHRVSPLVSVGGIFTYYKATDTTGDEPVTEKSYIFMPSVKFHWYQREWFSAYSKCAAGIGIDNDDEGTEAAFDWQASLLGLEVGRTVRFFTEAGFGDQGVVLAGLRVRF